MINILYEPFPDTIEADGVRYSIVTDFREWLKYADLIADKTVPDSVKLYLLSQWVGSPHWHLPPNAPPGQRSAEEPPAQVTVAFLDALHAFYVAEELEYTPPFAEDETDGDDVSLHPRPPCFDWCIDARYILGDSRRYYGIDLLHVDYLHWWAFKNLFYALPDDSMCMKRVSLRATDLSDIKDRAQRQKIAERQRRIALPFEYDDEMIGEALWNMN